MSPIKLIGAVLVFVGAVAIARDYSSYCDRRIKQSVGFMAFVKYIEERVCVYLLPRAEAAAGFDNAALSEIGFIELLRSSPSLYSAFSLVESRLLISDAQKEALSSFFKDFGRAYALDERARIEKLKTDMQSLNERDEKQTKESEKVVKTIVLASALGMIILLI